VDPITRVGIYERFQFVQEHEGVSTILVTHDMREAVKLASTLVILYQGRVAQAGATDEVLQNPSGDYVAALLKGQLE
jgi:osmoprotectant transport system ATP-binding protein